VDESHVTLPQVRAMYGGDYARKKTLVEYGFRLPSAFDNRPLKFEEVESKLNQMIFVSATPGEYERRNSSQVAQQVIRPTGLLDPVISVRPVEGQVVDLLGEINARIQRQERVLVTTLTKKMAEDLTDYLTEQGIKVKYMHHEVDTIRAHGDHQGSALGQHRRGGGHQPAARGSGSAGGEPCGHSGCRQGGLSAQ